jgi:hypothetical protein
VVIRHLWQLKNVVFLRWCLIDAVLLIASYRIFRLLKHSELGSSVGTVVELAPGHPKVKSSSPSLPQTVIKRAKRMNC